jgi:peptidoglycan/LPS O-acetylase OafA/YrhL
MFGFLRFLLAYLVIMSHVVGSAYLAHFGFYAVVGFFVIAGYVMTASLNEIYRFDAVRFCANRALRLLPPYYLVSLITLAVVAALPSQAGQYLKFWHGEMRLGDVLLNLSVLPMQTGSPAFRMVPPFWSVAIEIEMYVLLFLVVARRPGWALVALTTGLCYHLACSYADLGWAAHYFTAASAVLPFAAGALVYFVQRREPLPPIVANAAFAFWCVNMIAGGWIFSKSYIFGCGYYVGIASFTVVVFGLTRQKFSPMVSHMDRTLGEWAYFIFLVQWLAAFAVAVMLPPEQSRGWLLLMAATPVIIAAGAALSAVHRRLIEPFRDLLRRSSAHRKLGAAEVSVA